MDFCTLIGHAIFVRELVREESRAEGYDGIQSRCAIDALPAEVFNPPELVTSIDHDNIIANQCPFDRANQVSFAPSLPATCGTSYCFVSVQNMKVALLGLTHPHSDILFTTLSNLPEITTIYLWDPDPVVLTGTPFINSPKVSGSSVHIDEVLEDPALTFAIVCVRHDLSAEICLKVIQAGKHLLAEKPVGIDCTQILALQSAANEANVIASVLYARRHHPCMVAAQELLQSGSLGPVSSVECRFLTTQVKFREPESWLFRQGQAGGGILLWLGCHCLDLMQYVTNDPIEEIAAMTAIRSGEAIDVEDTATLSLKFRSGALGSFHAGYTLAYQGAGYVNNKGYDSYLGFNARNGRVVWPDLDPRLQIESPPESGGSPHRDVIFELPACNSYGGSYGEGFFRQFIAAIQGSGAPPTTLADAIRTARVVEAAAESARTKQFVRIS